MYLLSVSMFGIIELILNTPTAKRFREWAVVALLLNDDAGALEPDNRAVASGRFSVLEWWLSQWSACAQNISSSAPQVAKRADQVDDQP